jgi:hypothetical protein
MKSGYVGLAVKILILSACVAGVFTALGVAGYRVLGGHAGAVESVKPRNIILVLLERMESAFLKNREALDRERADLVAQLAAARTRVEKKRIEQLVGRLDQRRAENEARLSALAAEKKEIETREKAGDAPPGADDLKAIEETVAIKAYWKKYTDQIQTEFLTATQDDRKKASIRQAFAEDNGLTLITSQTREYYELNRELAALKGDTSAQDALDRSRSEQAESGDYIRQLEDKLKSLNDTVKKNEADLRDMDAQVTILLDQSNINGYFIRRGSRVQLLTNKKKETEILATGTYIVYDNNKKQVSKIYITRRGGRIDYTKLPGYDNPRPGNWF